MNRSLIALAPVLCVAASACAPNTTIPVSLDPGARATLAFVMPAAGAQIYECRVRKGEIDAYEWAFVAPDAELFDDRGRVIGRHGAGPAWEALDGSRVTGTLVARADSPRPGAIPWLLIAARSTGNAGTLSEVTSIQRVNTTGGTVPAIPCTRDGLGKQLRIRYTADYRFFVAHNKP